ncbi:hypothetical protein PRIPAC_84888 [Pristionchus pacificus]|uniref:Zinc finger protein n=1 Tax=Pristionchus pacificus TaxID=54126 RepID=A0A2A6BN65_PRIPA|nr:hypothetical protein PRIPAC_84888 [Pristionchus pacificus]|eukprot:PDM67402.1 zinc finger protein [Pristionchus pacificus]
MSRQAKSSKGKPEGLIDLTSQAPLAPLVKSDSSKYGSPSLHFTHSLTDSNGRATTDDCDQHESKRRKEDHSSSIYFSRSCRICVTDSPRCHAVFAPCGHIICRACALKLRWNSVRNNRAVVCPSCRSEGKFVDFIEDNHQATNNAIRNANALVREVADETRSTVADDDKLLKDALDTFEACIALGNAALSASDKSTAAAEALTDIIEVDIVELLAGRPALRGGHALESTEQSLNMRRKMRNVLHLDSASHALVAHAMRNHRIAAPSSPLAATRSAAIIYSSAMMSETCGQSEPKCCEEDNATTIRFSRACHICMADSPRYRAVFTPCGHVVCRACALKMKLAATKEELAALCLFCRGEGKFVGLDETPRIVGHQDNGAHEESGKRSDVNTENKDGRVNYASDSTRKRRFRDVIRSFFRSLFTSLRRAVTRLRNTATYRSDVVDVPPPTLAQEDALISAVAVSYEARMEAVKAAVTASRVSAAWGEVAQDLMREEYERERQAADDAIPDAVVIQGQVVERILAAQGASDRTKAISIQAYAIYLELSKEYEAKHSSVQRMIVVLEKENEKCAALGLQFSRACGACNEEEPRRRSILSNCGHAVCRACADAHASGAEAQCPVCSTAGNCSPLFEEVIDDQDANL